MTHKFSNNTKAYLVMILEEKITNNPQDSVFKNKKIYEEWYNPSTWEWPGKVKKAVMGPSDEDIKKQRKKTGEELKKSSGGFGKGEPKLGKSDTGPSVSKTLFGDKEERGEDEDLFDNPILKALGIGGMAVGGALAKRGLDTIAAGLKTTGGLGKYTGQALSSLGKQAEEISGKTWIESQLGKIGQTQMELAAQGAGSPWTKFVVPVKTKKQ